MEQGLLEGLINIINTVGFPIFVAIWFMYRSDKRQDKLIDLVQEMVSLQKATLERENEE